MIKTKWIIWIIAVFIVQYGWGYYVDYQYEKAIGSYIENAYEVNTPDEMINQIQLAIDGMKRESLTEQDYGALIFKKPDNSMAWQYKFLDNFIERAEAVKIWYGHTYKEGNTNTESLGDVYETKMDNLRSFLKEEGRADWIAKNAWIIKNNIFYYIIGKNILYMILALLFVSLIKSIWEI